MLNHNQWIEKQWPSYSFFDPRLHKRAINIANAIIDNPTASLLDRFEFTKEIKGFYRFLNNKSINHQMLQNQHYENVIKEASSTSEKVLFIQDSSELIYNNLKWVDLGPTSDSYGNGIMFHSSLAVKFHDNQPHVIGLSGQKAWIRDKKENKKI